MWIVYCFTKNLLLVLVNCDLLSCMESRCTMSNYGFTGTISSQLYLILQRQYRGRGGSNVSRNAAMWPVNFFICVYIYFFDEIFSFKIQIEVYGLDVHISVLLAILFLSSE